jgi:hypothetical protein
VVSVDAEMPFVPTPEDEPVDEIEDDSDEELIDAIVAGDEG